MKQVSIILFVAAFAYIQMFNGFVWVSYELNKSEIIQQFCINKDKPKLQCEGTCHMKKMMISEESEQSEEPSIVIPQTLLFFDLAIIDVENTKSDYKDFSNLNTLYSYNFTDELDIPPES